MADLVRIYDASVNAYRDVNIDLVVKSIEEAKKLEPTLEGAGDIISIYDATLNAYRELPKSLVEKQVAEAIILEQELIEKGLI